MMYSIFTMPNASSTMTSIATWSDAMFQNFLPVAYVVAGFAVGGIVLAFIISSVVGAVGKMTDGKGKYDE